MIEKSEFISALLGGGIAALTAAGFFWWEKSWAAKLREKEIAKLQTAQVFSVVTKLIAFLENQVSIKKHLDNCFDEAGVDAGSAEPADIVVELVLLPIGSERLTSEELVLCLKSGDQGLLEKLLSTQSKYLSTYHTMVKLNDLLSDYRAFKTETALTQSEISGDRGLLVMPAESRP